MQPVQAARRAWATWMPQVLQRNLLGTPGILVGCLAGRAWRKAIYPIYMMVGSGG